jgi:hypothetical protein
MENSKSGCAIFIDVENQADVKPCALIEFFEPYFAIEEKTACADFSRPNMRRIERKLATANINMVHVAKPVRTERTGSDLADYTLIKRVWATYRERRNRISTFVIVSGDCGFIGTVIALKQLNKTVIVAADPNRIGPGLREEADRFIPLVDGEPAPGDQWIEGDSEKHEATSLALPLLSDDRMIQLLLTLEEENHYMTFRLVARRTLAAIAIRLLNDDFSINWRRLSLTGCCSNTPTTTL